MSGKWLVVESTKIVRSLGRLPKQVLKKYEVWKDIVEDEGPQGLRVRKGLRDHALKGDLKGWRASYLGDQWRVEYRVKKSCVQVLVRRIHPHDY